MPDTALLSAHSKAKVVIIDDHPIVRAGFTALICRDPRFEMCGEADDVDSGVELIERLSPDIAIVDLALRNGNGLDLIRRVKASKLKVRMLVASMYDEALFAERAIRAGAAGYINKQEAGRRIVAALYDLLEGQVFLSERYSARILRQAVMGRPRSEESPVSRLSVRELEVFTMLGNGATAAQIAEKLQVSNKTVDTYRQRIKDKLLLTSSAELNREAMSWAVGNVK
jgi:DNA-binding NarL/FixJ family response regulator